LEAECGWVFLLYLRIVVVSDHFSGLSFLTTNRTGQVISTRVDLFPEAYTSKLQKLQDGIEAMPFAIVKQVVEQELLDGAPLSELFATFDETPLGCASIAQVHKATLLDGRVVAVKLQRPNVEPKLRGDIANLKRISKVFRKSLPVDYYAVFCELGDALENELNFLAEAQAMKKIHLAISHNNENGKNGGDSAGEKAPPPPPPVTIPLPIGELVTKRVLVMDFVPGVPLNRLSEIMEEKGIIAGSPESRLAGRRILDSLAVAFGRMIFGAGFLHGYV
jgi:aarF domain-containing kinase